MAVRKGIFKSIYGKLLLSHVIVATMAIMALGLLFSHLFEEYLLASRERVLVSRGQAVVLTVRNLLRVSPLTFELSLLLNSLDEFLQARVWLLDQNGVIVATSGNSEGFVGAKVDLTEYPELSAGKIAVRRGASRFGVPMLTVAVPVMVGGYIEGVLMMHSPVEAVRQTAAQVRRLMLLAGSAALLAASLFGFYLSEGISRPLRRMTEGVRLMAEGQYEQDIPVTTRDEVGVLAESVNDLAKRLSETMGALRQEKDKFASIVSGITDGVLAFDAKANLLWKNGPADHLIRDMDVVLPVVRQAIYEETRVEKEVDSGVTIINCVASPIADEKAGGPVGAVLLVHDITERHQLEQSRREFLASVSHELRTPLTAIRGFVEPLLDGTVSDSAARQRYLEIIRSEVLRLSRLVNDLFDLAKMDSGRFSVRRDLVDLEQVVYESLEVLNPMFQEKEIELEVVPPNPGDGKDQKEPGFDGGKDLAPYVIGDHDRLSQVVVNLVTNAIQSGEPGTKVRVWFEVDDTKVKVFVSDNGPGIAESDLPRIWEKFYKVDKSRRRSGQGTGLGLSIARGIIEAHGGTIGAESQVGKGTTFHFVLPRVGGE